MNMKQRIINFIVQRLYPLEKHLVWLEGSTQLSLDSSEQSFETSSINDDERGKQRSEEEGKLKKGSFCFVVKNGI